MHAIEGGAGIPPGCWCIRARDAASKSLQRAGKFFFSQAGNATTWVAVTPENVDPAASTSRKERERHLLIRQLRHPAEKAIGFLMHTGVTWFDHLTDHKALPIASMWHLCPLINGLKLHLIWIFSVRRTKGLDGAIIFLDTLKLGVPWAAFFQPSLAYHLFSNNLCVFTYLYIVYNYFQAGQNSCERGL